MIKPMKTPSDLTDDELGHLANAIGPSGTPVPSEVAKNFIESSLADRTDFGLKITNKGLMFLNDAKALGRIR